MPVVAQYRDERGRFATRVREARGEDTSQMPIVTDRPIAARDRVMLKPVDDYPDNVDVYLSRALRDAGGRDGVFTVARLYDSDRRHPLLELVDIDGGYYVERFTFAPDAEPLSEDTDVAPGHVADVSAPFAVGDRVVLKSVDEHSENGAIPDFIPELTLDGVFTVTHIGSTCLTLDGVSGTHYVNRFKAAPVVLDEIPPEPEPAPADAPDPFAVGDRVVTVAGFASGDVWIGSAGTVTRVNAPDFGIRENIAVKVDGSLHGGYFGHGEYIAFEDDGVDGSPMSAWAHIPVDGIEVGTRVRVLAASHINVLDLGSGVGVVREIDPTMTMEQDIPHPWRVSLDNGDDLWASRVVLSAAPPVADPDIVVDPPAPAPDDPLADWELELLDGAAETPGRVVGNPASYNVGDRVTVLASAADDGSEETGNFGRAFMGETFPLTATVGSRNRQEGYYSLTAAGRIQTVHETHMRPAEVAEVVTYSQVHLDLAVATAHAEGREDGVRGAAINAQVIIDGKQGTIDALNRQAVALSSQLDDFKRKVANTLLGRLVADEGWDRDDLDQVLCSMDIDPSVYIDDPVWEFKVTETITYTVRATRGDGNRDVEPSIDYIQSSITDVDSGDVSMDSDWLDVEVVDTDSDWEVQYGSIDRVEQD